MGDLVTLYRVTRTVQGTNGTSKDEYVNTFWLMSNLDLAGNAPSGVSWASAIADTLDGFFLTVDSTGSRVLEYMSNRYQGPSQLRIYTSPPGDSGPPIASATGTVAFVPPDIQSLPEECAVCLSYNIIPPGVIPARARGRIYIGPLNVAAMDDVTSNDQPVHVNPALMQLLLGAGASVQGALAGAGIDWCLYSRRNAEAYVISQFSVDDAFDTIRGRGTAPSVRIRSS
jgi:hypothetical protein